MSVKEVDTWQKVAKSGDDVSIINSPFPVDHKSSSTKSEDSTTSFSDVSKVSTVSTNVGEYFSKGFRNWGNDSSPLFTDSSPDKVKAIVPEKFANGGFVSGGIRGKDSVPALLQHGEYVLNVDQVEQWKQLSNSMRTISPSDNRYAQVGLY